MSDAKLPIKAMILAAGEGTRLRPLTVRMPKCMVPINGKPVLEHNIEWMRSFGIREFVINLHHMPEAVIDYFADGSNWNVKIRYSREESLLGTAGGLKNAERHFDGSVLLWYGDNLSTIDLYQFGRFHAQKGGLATIAVFHRDDPTSSGIIGVDERQRIYRFLEKPSADQVFSHWVNAGIYLLEPRVLEYIPPGVFSDFGHEILPALLAHGEPMFAYQMHDSEKLWWIDTLVDLERIHNSLERRVSSS